MKLLLRTAGCMAVLFFFPAGCLAQIKIFSGTGDVAEATRKVIQDYPNRFSRITGDLIIQNPQSADYHCTVKIKEAEHCFITKYTSGNKVICSWQALLLTTESFDKAKRKFKAVYGQLNSLAINAAYLKGAYEPPEEGKKFTSILFPLSPVDEATRKLKTELVMESEGMEWKVKVLVYEREREDNEKGNVLDE